MEQQPRRKTRFRQDHRQDRRIRPLKKKALAGEEEGARVSRIPDFVPPQLARLVDAPPSGDDWVHEVKFDGYRMQLRVEAGKAKLMTRKGLDWTHRFPEIAAEGARFADCMIDGEICALDEQGRTDFAGLQDALSSGRTGALAYFVFDLLFEGKSDLRKLPLDERKARLKRLLAREAKNSRRILFTTDFAESGQSVLEAACRLDLEGVISKKRDAPYVSARNGTWMKSKCRGGQEVVIGGWRGEANKLRSLLVGTYENGALVYRGRVGTGFPAALAADVLERLKKLEQAKPAFSNPPRGKDIFWIAPKLVGEIEYETITTDGLFRQAAFKGLRLDKPAENITLETAAQPAPKETVMAAKRKPGSTRALKSFASKRMTKMPTAKPTVCGIQISHPEKVFWPETRDTRAFTKLDLAEYYAQAAERMLVHVAERPISIVRAPDGINGQLFYQRHQLMGTAVPMLGIKVRGEAKPYLGIDSAKSLVALAQAGVIEIHPWGSKKGEPDTPERVILDLDPAPDVPFARVIEGAKELRARLTKLGFESFVKTTGGKGLHVVVAVKGTPKNPITWPDAKAFAKAIAVSMAEDSPERYTTTIAKKARTGKIFVDYLRNDRTSTGVAPWSARARPAAPVATPLTWSQVKAGLDPHAFRLDTAAALLKRADPWKDLAKSARALPR